MASQYKAVVGIFKPITLGGSGTLNKAAVLRLNTWAKLAISTTSAQNQIAMLIAPKVCTSSSALVNRA